MDTLLVAGLWLDGTAWDEVAPAIEARGHRPVPITLPGQGTSPGDATLQDQVDAIVAAVDAAAGQVLVVGHSAACSLAWLTADARPDRVARVVLIGGFPNADGEAYADFFPSYEGAMPFPGWEPFDGADSADLTDDQKKLIADNAIPVPETVTKGVVRLSNPARYEVPVTLICPEFSPEQAKEWIGEGEVPELAKAKNVELVDIDSGHWPMFTQPQMLADLLADEAERGV